MVDVLAAETRSSARRGPHHGTKRTLDTTDTAPKRRRLVHIGSSPPPYSTAYSDNPGPARTATAPVSPRAESKRNAPSTRSRNALSLRASSLITSPPPVPPIAVTPDPLPRPKRRGAQGDVAGDQGLRMQTRQLQSLRTLACADPDSPIGTFGGQILPRSIRDTTCKGRRASRAEALTTDALSRGNHPHLAPAGGRTTSTRSADAKVNNADSADAKQEVKLKRPAEGRIVKQRRRQPKIQRVQFGGVQALETHYPLNEAHSRASVPPISDDSDAADESEITYFPTLPPKRPHVGTHMQTMQTADASSPFLDNRPSLSDAASSPQPLLAPNDATRDHGDPESEGDSSRGLLEVLSQTALRRMNDANSPQQSQHVGHAHANQAAWQTLSRHDIRIEFDAAHLSHLQARRIAGSLTRNGSDRPKWTSVQLDSDHPRRRKLPTSALASIKAVRAAWYPPTRRSVCDDLCLTAKQASQKEGSDRLEFVHFDSSELVHEEPAEDLENLPAFEHRIHFAGYRLQKQVPHGAEPSAFPCLESFDGEEWPTQRGPVVKILVPLSGPSLHPAASPARFIKPHDTRDEALGPAANDTVLVWTPTTARRFLAELDEQVATGEVSSYAELRGLEASELELCPSPILHYMASTGSPGADVLRSHIALYVHAHRVQEARSVLATLELGDMLGGAPHKFKPFSDPKMRLLIVSMVGTPLGLI
ncbi:hypothetical protein PANT_5c00094 [Moesziomyces antarcticus T-34]|uniref:Uncharacterized protein n=1 Tax=Pseudozyma antarctica (strain T-34) TaxID=1151754 RepID=M9LK82_PSEA3|nr:hypothetical protein PANT_5c00094 [Moesziomyces antarcticus T-34]